MKETNIALNADDFQCLVSGGKLIVIDHANNIRTNIILQDIGFYLMRELIERVEDGKVKAYQDLPKEI